MGSAVPADDQLIDVNKPMEWKIRVEKPNFRNLQGRKKLPNLLIINTQWRLFIGPCKKLEYSPFLSW